MAPPPQPELPHPAHLDRDSALGRKFGKEVTNYFGGNVGPRIFASGAMTTKTPLTGSPLNRLSFLREDYEFLAKAFAHPTTKFLVFKTLSPLIKSPTEIHYATYDDIKSLVPSNPFEKSEKETLEDFDSRVDTPQLVFLGVDESVKDGLNFRHFCGAPHWAIDITPKPTYEKEANELNEKFLASGLKFSEGMRAMSFPADVGESLQIYFFIWLRSGYCADLAL